MTCHVYVHISSSALSPSKGQPEQAVTRKGDLACLKPLGFCSFSEFAQQYGHALHSHALSSALTFLSPFVLRLDDACADRHACCRSARSGGGMERQASAAHSTQSERPPRPESMYRRFTSMSAAHSPPPPPTVDQFMGRRSIHARSPSMAASDSALTAHPVAIPVDVQVGSETVHLRNRRSSSVNGQDLFASFLSPDGWNP